MPKPDLLQHRHCQVIPDSMLTMDDRLISAMQRRPSSVQLTQRNQVPVGTADGVFIETLAWLSVI